MSKVYLIGFGAGLAALAMLLSPMGASLLAVPMMMLAPLPIVIAGLGWGTLAAATGTLTGFVTALFALQLPAALMFAAAVGVPATFAAHLLGLARASAGGAPAEWYPLSRVVLMLTLWCGLLGGAVTYIVGINPAADRAELIEALGAMFAVQGAPPPAAEVEAMASMLVAVMPYAFAAMWLCALLLSLWIGALVVRRSGLLVRPWEDLNTFRPEPSMVVLLGAALVMTYAPEPIGFLARPFVGALSVAHIAVGLAVLHWLSRPWSMRVPALAIFYGLMFIVGLPALLALVLGLVDRFFDLRGLTRRTGGEPPPLP